MSWPAYSRHLASLLYTSPAPKAQVLEDVLDAVMEMIFESTPEQDRAIGVDCGKLGSVSVPDDIWEQVLDAMQERDDDERLQANAERSIICLPTYRPAVISPRWRSRGAI